VLANNNKNTPGFHQVLRGKSFLLANIHFNLASGAALVMLALAVIFSGSMVSGDKIGPTMDMKTKRSVSAGTGGHRLCY
jgi:hypothetical protein